MTVRTCERMPLHYGMLSATLSAAAFTLFTKLVSSPSVFLAVGTFRVRSVFTHSHSLTNSTILAVPSSHQSSRTASPSSLADAPSIIFRLPCFGSHAERFSHRGHVPIGQIIKNKIPHRRMATRNPLTAKINILRRGVAGEGLAASRREWKNLANLVGRGKRRRNPLLVAEETVPLRTEAFAVGMNMDGRAERGSAVQVDNYTIWILAKDATPEKHGSISRGYPNELGST